MKRIGLKLMALSLIAASVLFFAGCQNGQVDGGSGALLGGLAGAGIGQLAGDDTESTLIGAGIGAGAGYLLGEQQKQKREIETIRREANAVTVYVINSNGSKTPVVIRRQGNVYIGPNGEQYDTVPTSEQLKPVYGF